MSDTPTEETNNEPEAGASEDEKLISAEETIDAAIERSSVKEKKKLGRKKQIKYGAAGLGIAVLGYLVYLLFAPYKSTQAYGICKTFLELNTRYPHTLRLSTVEEIGSSVRIWYTQIDSFGEYRMEPIQCYFKQGENAYGMALEKVTIRRRELDKETVERFNKSLDVLYVNQPDLTAPAPLPDSLRGLQIETDRFRKPIL